MWSHLYQLLSSLKEHKLGLLTFSALAYRGKAKKGNPRSFTTIAEAFSYAYSPILSKADSFANVHTDCRHSHQDGFANPIAYGAPQWTKIIIVKWHWNFHTWSRCFNHWCPCIDNTRRFGLRCRCFNLFLLMWIVDVGWCEMHAITNVCFHIPSSEKRYSVLVYHARVSGVSILWSSVSHVLCT